MVLRSSHVLLSLEKGGPFASDPLQGLVPFGTLRSAIMTRPAKAMQQPRLCQDKTVVVMRPLGGKNLMTREAQYPVERL